MREIRSPLDGIWSPFAARAAQVAALSGARTLVQYETEALALDFTDNYFYSTTSLYGSAYVKDTGTPANDYDSTPYGLLTYTSPSAKMTRGPDGLLRFGAHNLAVRSAEVDNASWVKSSSTITANATNGPPGTATAEEWTETATTAQHYVYQSVTAIVGATYAVSIALKASTSNWTIVAFEDSSGTHGRYVNLSDGTFGATIGTPITSAIASLGDGWYRVTIEQAASGTTIYLTCYTTTGDSGGLSHAGSTSNKRFIWGGHIRRTPSDSTYLATTSAARYALPYEWDASGNLQGILVEEQRTNLATYSNTFSNAAWSKDRSTVTQGQTSPTGDADAWLFAEDATAANSHIMYHGITWTAVAHTFSMFVKVPASNARNWIYLVTWDGSAERGKFFNISTGAEGASIGSPTSTGITSLGGGLYRCWITLTPAAAFGNFQIGLASADNTRTYDGDGVSGCIVYGADVEAGSFPTSYIPTLGSTVTRAADNISLVTSKFPWDAATDSVYAKFRPLNVAAERRAIQLDDSTANERFTVGSDASANGFAQIVDGGATQLGPLTTGTVTTTAFEQMALAFAANDVALSSDGGAAATDTSATVPTVTTLRFGSGVSAASPLNGILAKALIVPRRVPNADLQTLTGTGVLPAP